MTDDLTEKIREFLKDPDAVSKIMSVASSLSPKPNTENAAEPQQTQSESSTIAAAASSSSSPLAALASHAAPDRRLALLMAIKPLLREDKRPKIDAVQRAMTVATMFGKFKT
ncbi:MAG: hypothetical protein RR057_01560 [Clostridia bacterium]